MLISPLYGNPSKEFDPHHGYTPRALPLRNVPPTELKRGKSLIITNPGDIKPVMRLVSELNQQHWENPGKPRFTMRLNKRCDTLTVKRIK